MLFRILLWTFILVMIFRFVVRFVFPFLKIMRVTRDRLRHMQQQMDDMQRQQTSATMPSQKVKEGEYIDYEEVK